MLVSITKKKKNFLFWIQSRKLSSCNSKNDLKKFKITKNPQNRTFDLKVCVNNKPKTPISAKDVLFKFLIRSYQKVFYLTSSSKVCVFNWRFNLPQLSAFLYNNCIIFCKAQAKNKFYLQIMPYQLNKYIPVPKIERKDFNSQHSAVFWGSRSQLQLYFTVVLLSTKHNAERAIYYW